MAGASGQRKRNILPYVEFAFGVYMSVCAVLSMIDLRAAMTTPFLVIFAFGFFYVSVLSFQAARAGRPATRAKALAGAESASV